MKSIRGIRLSGKPFARDGAVMEPVEAMLLTGVN